MSDLALLSILFAAIIILCTLRYRDARTSSNIIKEYQIGSAMTIGNREVQQDCFGSKINKDSVLMVLADGIRQDGHIAAKLAVDTFENLFIDVHSIDKPQYFFKRADKSISPRISSGSKSNSFKKDLFFIFIALYASASFITSLIEVASPANP